MQALQSQKKQYKKKNWEIYAHYVQSNLLCVLTHALGYDANTKRNKEAVHYLNQGAINLVLKLKAHLISTVT